MYAAGLSQDPPPSPTPQFLVIAERAVFLSLLLYKFPQKASPPRTLTAKEAEKIIGLALGLMGKLPYTPEHLEVQDELTKRGYRPPTSHSVQIIKAEYLPGGVQEDTNTDVIDTPTPPVLLVLLAVVAVLAFWPQETT